MSRSDSLSENPFRYAKTTPNVSEVNTACVKKFSLLDTECIVGSFLFVPLLWRHKTRNHVIEFCILIDPKLLKWLLAQKLWTSRHFAQKSYRLTFFGCSNTGLRHFLGSNYFDNNSSKMKQAWFNCYLKKSKCDLSTCCAKVFNYFGDDFRKKDFKKKHLFVKQRFTPDCVVILYYERTFTLAFFKEQWLLKLLQL